MHSSSQRHRGHPLSPRAAKVPEECHHDDATLFSSLSAGGSSHHLSIKDPEEEWLWNCHTAFEGGSSQGFHLSTSLLICRAAPGSSLCSCNQPCPKLSAGSHAARGATLPVTQLHTATAATLQLPSSSPKLCSNNFKLQGETLTWFFRQKKLPNSGLHWLAN